MGEPDDAAAKIWQTAEQFVTLREVEAAARSVIEPGAWNFLEGGAGDERTLAANAAAFDRWQFRPRFMTGISRPVTTTTFLGVALATPVYVAPFGFDRLFHTDGHKAVALGAAASGAMHIVPEMASFTLEDIATVGGSAPRTFQLVPIGDDDHVLKMAGRAVDAGYDAICVTVDTAMPGWRERSMEDRFVPDMASALANYGPGTGMDVSVVSDLVTFARPLWTWDRLRDVLSSLTIPWMVKGVLTGDDAALAVDAGASAVLVSNHGGRQLDRSPAALNQLREVVDAVASRAEVGIDGGVRRGSDIATALALGARVVGVGRPVAWGLAADGEAGVGRVLSILQSELVTTMALLGVDAVDNLDESLLQPAHA